MEMGGFQLAAIFSSCGYAKIYSNGVPECFTISPPPLKLEISKYRCDKSASGDAPCEIAGKK